MSEEIVTQGDALLASVPVTDDAFVIVLVSRSLSWRQRRLKSTDAPSSPFLFAARRSTLPSFLPLSTTTTIQRALPPPLDDDDYPTGA